MNESPGSSHDRRRNSNLRWIICGLPFLATTVNYADRQVIGILKPRSYYPIFAIASCTYLVALGIIQVSGNGRQSGCASEL
jgi:hypothetical protein